MGLEGWGYEKTADNTEIETCKERALLLDCHLRNTIIFHY